MGQRLVIEIWRNKERLANAYYHWSGYTKSSLGLLSEIIHFLGDKTITNYKLTAIKALESTGAGLQDAERKEAERLYPNESFGSYIDRDFGILAITKDKMDELFGWNEGFITVDISDNTFYFDVCFVDKDPLVMNELGNQVVANPQNIVETSFDLDRICFEEFEDFYQLCKELEYNRNMLAKVICHNGEVSYMTPIRE